MRYTAYGLVYVLNRYYSGNKTQMAHEMRMPVADFFKQFRRVVTEGKDSPTMLERLHKLCGRRGINMNEIWAAYTADPNLEPIETDPCPYYHIMMSLNDEQDILYENTYAQQQRLRITEAADALIKEIRDACCGLGQTRDGFTICNQYRRWKESGVLNDTADCPCQHIAAMLRGLDDSSRA